MSIQHAETYSSKCALCAKRARTFGPLSKTCFRNAHDTNPAVRNRQRVRRSSSSQQDKPGVSHSTTWDGKQHAKKQKKRRARNKTKAPGPHQERDRYEAKLILRIFSTRAGIPFYLMQLTMSTHTYTHILEPPPAG